MRAAVAFLTAVGGSATPDERTVRWFPIVGALLGVALGGLWWGAGELWPATLAAVIVVAADLAATRMLHVDGLADSADGLLPPLASPERRLAVMADPVVGAFGVTTVGIVLITRVAALTALTPHPLALAGLWCASRTAMAVVATTLPYTGGGLATAFLGSEPHRQRTPVLLLGLPLATGLAVAAEGWPGAAGIAAVVVTAAAVAAFAWRRIGGFSGDVLGALCVLAETIGLLVLARAVVSATRALAGRLGGAAIGIVVDRVFGEPPLDPHPVAAFGAAVDHVEQQVWSDSRARGVLHAAVGTGAAIAVGAISTRLVGSTASTAAATYVTTAAHGLAAAAVDVRRALDDDDLPRARELLPSLVGRDPSGLDRAEIARAVVESVAENTVDGIVAPAMWGAMAGAPGALGYRAANTLDSMVGHRNDRYQEFGWASARLDDAANYIPARTTAVLVTLCRPNRARAIAGAIRHDAPAHPSPNAGVAEAAFAAALDLRLGGTNQYDGTIDERARLGDGRAPCARDIDAAVLLSRDVTDLLTIVLVVKSMLLALASLTADAHLRMRNPRSAVRKDGGSA